MSKAAPIAVVGAGVVGIACARALQRVGRSVLVLDPLEPGAACSAGNAGRIATELIQPLARPATAAALPRLLHDPLGPLTLKPAGLPALLPWMARFAFASLPRRFAAGTAALAELLRPAWPAWREEIAASGLDDLFVSAGAMTLYESARSAPAARREARDLAAHGIPFQDLSGKVAAERVPGMAVPVTAGRLYPATVHVRDPLALTQALARRFAAEGGRIERLSATGFDVADGIVRAVRTQSGGIEVAGLVLAAGAGASTLARALGANAPLARERGYHAMVPSADLPIELPITFAERGFVMTPMEGGTRLAGTVELGAGASPDWRRADILLMHARELFRRPSLAAASRWHGDRPTLPDYLPMIGRAPRARNAVLALGHQHLGLTLAAITGRLVAELIADAPPSVNLAPFRAERFG